MPTNFPTALDTFLNPAAGDPLTGPGAVPHHLQHANLNDAVAALEAKLGVNGSAVTSSVDYLLANVYATRQYVDTSIAGLSDVYMRWVPYTGPGQSFLRQDLTRDGDWTMVANKGTSDRPGPQATGPEEDLLPSWTPATNSARASYTVYDEWTLSQGGWVDQYGIDVLSQNLSATHTITLAINGVTRDTFTTTPAAAGGYWHNITPIVAPSGSVLRVTLQVQQVSNNLMYWVQQAALFAAAPPYCSQAVGSKDGAAAGTTAYGCHVLFIPGTMSPDWDVVAYGGAAAAPAAAAVGVTAADGFLYVPWREGPPAGEPPPRPGTVPLVYDIASDRLYVYRGGWKSLAFS